MALDARDRVARARGLEATHRPEDRDEQPREGLLVDPDQQDQQCRHPSICANGWLRSFFAPEPRGSASLTGRAEARPTSPLAPSPGAGSLVLAGPRRKSESAIAAREASQMYFLSLSSGF